MTSVIFLKIIIIFPLTCPSFIMSFLLFFPFPHPSFIVDIILKKRYAVRKVYETDGFHLREPFSQFSEVSSQLCSITSVCWFLLKAGVSLSVVSDSLRPQGLYPASLLCPWKSLSKNSGVGCHSLLQRIFLIRGWNPDLLIWRQILYIQIHKGSPFWFLFSSVQFSSVAQSCLTDSSWAYTIQTTLGLCIICAVSLEIRLYSHIVCF